MVWRERCLLRASGRTVPFFCPEIVLSILIFAALAGMRYDVGVDHLAYLRFYKELCLYGHTSRETFEPLFLLIGKLFASLEAHYSFYFAFLAALQIGFVYYALRDSKEILPYVVLYILLGPYFLDWMNGIRQNIVCCLFIWLVRYIADRRILLYAAFVLIAAFVHRSAIMLLPIYVIAFLPDITRLRKINILILLLCVVLGSSPVWMRSLQFIEHLLAFAGYDIYAERATEMISGDSFRITAWGPGRISIFLVSIILIWYLPDMARKYTDDKLFSLYAMLFLIGVWMYNLFVNTSHIFLRPVMYFLVFRLVMFGYCMRFFRAQRKRVCSLVLGSIALIYVYYVCYKAVVLNQRFVLYKFFFEV